MGFEREVGFSRQWKVNKAMLGKLASELHKWREKGMMDLGLDL